MNKIYRVILFLLVLSALFVVLGERWPLGDDYFFTYRAVTESFLRGETRLYDSNSLGFYTAPWTILIMMPTLLFSPQYGEALLIIISLIGMMIASNAVSKQNDRFTLLVIFLTVINMYTFDLLTRGNIDGLLVLGIGLGWLGIKRNNPLLLGAGFWFLSLKPVNVIFPGLVFLKAIWDWSWKDKITAAAPLGLTFLISLPVFGVNWIHRYLTAMQEYPPLRNPQITLWRLPEPLGFPQQYSLGVFALAVIIFGIFIFTSKKVNRDYLALALTGNLVFSPYVLGSHYVLLIPVFVILAQEYRWLISLWLLTWIPVILLILRAGIYWPSIFYPLSMLIGAGYLVVENTKNKNSKIAVPEQEKCN